MLQEDITSCLRWVYSHSICKHNAGMFWGCVSWTYCSEAAVTGKAISQKGLVLPLVRIALVCAGTLNYIA